MPGKGKGDRGTVDHILREKFCMSEIRKSRILCSNIVKPAKSSFCIIAHKYHSHLREKKHRRLFKRLIVDHGCTSRFPDISAPTDI